MATAEELLDRAISGDRAFIGVDMEMRRITIPITMKYLGVESDDDVTRLYFRMDRFYEDIDLYEFDKQINYVNANGDGDVYKIDDADAEENNITFSWLVGRTALAYKGSVKFNICLKETLPNDPATVIREINTTPVTIEVLEGLETSEAVVQQYADILSSWEMRLFGIGNTEEQRIRNAGDAEEQRIRNAGNAEELEIRNTGEEILTNIESRVDSSIIAYANEHGFSVPSDGHIEDVAENVIEPIAEKVNGLHKVATSGSYNDLVNKPTSFTPSTHTHTASQVTGLSKVATTGSYKDLANIPSTFYPAPHSHKAVEVSGLAAVATSGSYKDLANIPSTFYPAPHSHSIMWDPIAYSDSGEGTYTTLIQGGDNETNIASVTVDIHRAGYYVTSYAAFMKSVSSNGVASMLLRREGGGTSSGINGRSLVPISKTFINTGRIVNMIYIPAGTWTITLFVKADVDVNCTGHVLFIYDPMAIA